MTGRQVFGIGRARGGASAPVASIDLVAVKVTGWDGQAEEAGLGRGLSPDPRDGVRWRSLPGPLMFGVLLRDLTGMILSLCDSPRRGSGRRRWPWASRVARSRPRPVWPGCCCYRLSLGGSSGPDTLRGMSSPSAVLRPWLFPALTTERQDVRLVHLWDPKTGVLPAGGELRPRRRSRSRAPGTDRAGLRDPLQLWSVRRNIYRSHESCEAIRFFEEAPDDQCGMKCKHGQDGTDGNPSQYRVPRGRTRFRNQ